MVVIIDLHNNTRYIAREKLNTLLKTEKNKKIEIIVGRGLHSINNIPVIKNYVIKYLKSKNIKYIFKKHSKEGVILINI